MSQIKGHDTKPEILLRKALWFEGFRYRLKNNLPGKPDLALPKYKAVIFVDGCFWHRCPEHFVQPKTNKKFWSDKIDGNVRRDKENDLALIKMGWQVIRIWEHELKENPNKAVNRILKCIR